MSFLNSPIRDDKLSIINAARRNVGLTLERKRQKTQNLLSLETPYASFCRGGKEMDFSNLFHSCFRTSAFLILSGPSLREYDLNLVKSSNIISMGVNNSWSVFTPDLWLCVDPPRKFLSSGWTNPKIMKFVPETLAKNPIRRKESGGQFASLPMAAKETPNTYTFKRNSSFNHETFLSEPTINWGQTGKKSDSLGVKGSRSVMLAAIKLLYILGIRDVYLLGCDFHMTEENKYAFEENRGKGAIRGNNRSYKIMAQRFEAMKNHFEEKGLNVYNCNKKSNLEVFPYRSIHTALNNQEVLNPPDVDTEGWYEEAKK